MTMYKPEEASPLPDPPAFRANADLAPGEIVGEYRIEHKLGKGGFGSVYRAVHPVIGKMAAIKVLNQQLSSSPEMVSRFIAEARAVNQIRHRNIVDIFSFGALPDGRQYYIMELLEGLTLERFIRERGRIEPEVAILILRGVARALDAAHATGIAHRDLKPENIFLIFEDEDIIFPKLLDFGIAKLLVDTMHDHKTQTGAPIGTPRYMSPEQCRGRKVDHRTDIYSFGVLTHMALTGQPLFEGDGAMDLMFHHLHTAPPSVSSVCPDLSTALDRPILRMLEKDPAARPASIVEAVEALASAALEAGHPISGAAIKSVAGRTSGEARDSRPHSQPSWSAPRPLSTDRPMSSTETKTVVRSASGSQKTLRAAEFPAAPSLGKRVAVVALAAGTLGVGLAAMFLLRTTEPTAPEPQIPPPVAVKTSGPAATPREGAALAGTPAPATVEVRIDIKQGPKDAAVFLGAERLGEAPGPFRIPRGAAPVRITVKADGYTPRELEIAPNSDRTVSTSLSRSTPAKSTRNSGPSDLENPF